MSHRRFTYPGFGIALGVLLISSSPGSAQKAPPVVPNPQAPALAMPAPMGIQRGTALELGAAQAVALGERLGLLGLLQTVDRAHASLHRERIIAPQRTR